MSIHIKRIYRNYLKAVPSHCEQRNHDKVKKTISKMAEPPKNGVRKVVFLTEVDFSKAHSASEKIRRKILGVVSTILHQMHMYGGMAVDFK